MPCSSNPDGPRPPGAERRDESRQPERPDASGGGDHAESRGESQARVERPSAQAPLGWRRRGDRRRRLSGRRARRGRGGVGRTEPELGQARPQELHGAHGEHRGLARVLRRRQTGALEDGPLAQPVADVDLGVRTALIAADSDGKGGDRMELAPGCLDLRGRVAAGAHHGHMEPRGLQLSLDPRRRLDGHVVRREGREHDDGARLVRGVGAARHTQPRDETRHGEAPRHQGPSHGICRTLRAYSA